MALNDLPYAQRAAEIERQRRYAELLQQQAAEPLQSQMVGNRVVPISPWLGLAKMLQAGIGGYYAGKANEQEAALKKQSAEEAKKYFTDLATYAQKGEKTGETPITTEISGYGATQPLPVLNVQDGKFSQAMKDVYTPATKAGMLARMMEGMSSENPDIAKYASTYGAALMPTAEEYGTPFESGGQMYTMSKSGNVKPLNLAAPTKQASLPSSVQEYEYAVKQGFKGSLADYEKMKAINVNVPAAETYGAMTTAIDPVTGQPIYVRGGSRGSIQRVEGFAPPPVQPTESQTVSGTYANKVQDAEDVLGKYGAGSPYKPPSMVSQNAADIPYIGNQLVDEDTQKYKTAERSFIEAWLRKTSGAAISASEYDQARKQYIPQLGDSESTLEQKRKARQRVFEGMAKGAGPSFNVQPSASVDSITAGTETAAQRAARMGIKINDQ